MSILKCAHVNCFAYKLFFFFLFNNKAEKLFSLKFDIKSFFSISPGRDIKQLFLGALTFPL